MFFKRVLKHFHICCGLGGGAKGFNQAKPIVGHIQAGWQCIGGVDVDPAGLRDFQRLSGVPGTLMDLFTRDQYTHFHGKAPPADWTEASADDLRRAANNERPDAVFISSPCKGASGLLSETMSMTPKYQALNELTLRCIWLMCEAWKNDPVPLLVFENVPRLATRGRHLLDQINKLLGHYGYAVAETTHDCGVIGGWPRVASASCWWPAISKRYRRFCTSRKRRRSSRLAQSSVACHWPAMSKPPARCTGFRHCNGKHGFALPWCKQERTGAA